MKTLSLVMKSLKLGVALMVLWAIAKIVLVAYFGYASINAEYGGPFYYNWRTNYADNSLIKSFYSKNKETDQKKNAAFSYYLSHVQEERTTTPPRFPYYSYGLQDSFVLGPRISWRIFASEKDADGVPLEPTKMRHMAAELSFLRFRARFIEHMYGISHGASKSAKAPRQYYSVLSTDSLNKFFETPGNDFNGIREDFSRLVGHLLSNKGAYSVSLTRDSAMMSPALQREALALAAKALPGITITAEDLNGFFYRLATVTLTPLDAHILNRIYFYYLFTVSDKNIAPGVDTLYDKHVERLEKLKEEKEKSAGAWTDEKERRLKAADNRRGARRMELIFNDFSRQIADVLGSKGAVMEGDADQRGIFERFGTPGVRNKLAVDAL